MYENGLLFRKGKKNDLKWLIKKKVHFCSQWLLYSSYVYHPVHIKKFVYELKTINAFSEMSNDSITHHNKYHIIIWNAYNISYSIYFVIRAISAIIQIAVFIEIIVFFFD